jgi:dipeptide/tripeptide permease
MQRWIVIINHGLVSRDREEVLSNALQTKRMVERTRQLSKPARTSQASFLGVLVDERERAYRAVRLTSRHIFWLNESQKPALVSVFVDMMDTPQSMLWNPSMNQLFVFLPDI